MRRQAHLIFCACMIVMAFGGAISAQHATDHSLPDKAQIVSPRSAPVFIPTAETLWGASTNTYNEHWVVDPTFQSSSAPEGCWWTGCSACGGDDRRQCDPKSRFCTYACNNGGGGSGCIYDKIC